MSTPHNDYKHPAPNNYHQYGYPSPYGQPRPDLTNQNPSSKTATSLNATHANFNANAARGSRSGSTPTLNQLLLTSNMDPRYHNNFAPPKTHEMMGANPQYPNPAWNNMPRHMPPHMQQYRGPVSTRVLSCKHRCC